MLTLTAPWDAVLIGALVAIVGLLLLAVWALCRAAARADRDMERIKREDLDRR